MLLFVDMCEFAMLKAQCGWQLDVVRRVLGVLGVKGRSRCSLDDRRNPAGKGEKVSKANNKVKFIRCIYFNSGMCS